MAVYRTTEELLKSCWENENFLPSTDLYPEREYCTTWRDISYRDIELWELIHHIPGGISVYAAWNPYTEFYIIVHDLFKETPAAIESFYGPRAEEELLEKLKTYGVTLSKNRVWINPDFSWMYDQLTPSNQKHS